MRLYYHRKNFYCFDNINIKRILDIIPTLKISNEMMTNTKYSDNRKKVIHDENNLFLTNLYLNNLILKIMNFYREQGINLFPIIQKFPFSYSVLTDADSDGLKLHCDTSGVDISLQRYVGCIIYLNDDYEGGELIFPLLDLKMKPKPGTLLTYRSDIQFPHYVKKVTKGKKWLLQGYFRIRNDNE